MIANCVYAENWVRCDSVYVETESLTGNENSVQGWVIGPEFAKSKFANRQYMYEAFYLDCKCNDRERQMAFLKHAWLNKWHLREIHNSTDTSFIKILPRTNNEVMFKALCKQRKRIMQLEKKTAQNL